MAGHLASKKPKLAKIEGPNCKKLLNPLPIKGGAEISAQIKAKTQLNSAQIAAPKTVHKATNSKPKSHQKPSKNCEKSLVLCHRVCSSSKGCFC